MKNPQSHLPKGAIGKDRIVINTVLNSSQNKKYIETLLNRVKLKLSETDLENYKIGIGCRSGIHRSVVVTDYLTEILSELGYQTKAKHIHLKVK